MSNTCGAWPPRHIVSFGLGDWCPPNSQDGYGHECPIPVTSTGYYYANCRMLARIAALLGKPEDASRYTARAEEIKAAFTRTFYDADTARIADGGQTAQACALFQGLVAAGRGRARAGSPGGGRRGDMTTMLTFGILGAKYVLNALAQLGRADVAYTLATQTAYPSWGHWIAQGATTLWEAWEGTTSRNHIMFGDISAWFFRTLAGIQPDPAAPGFKHVIIAPYFPDDLSWVRAEHRSPYGLIRSAWRREADGLLVEVDNPRQYHRDDHAAGAAGEISESGAARWPDAPGVLAVSRRRDHHRTAPSAPAAIALRRLV